MKFARGAIVLVELDPAAGHEQKGVRPCIVVSDPSVILEQRFPMVCVVPITGTLGLGLFYPEISPGRSGLLKKSCALVDQIRSIDKRRIRTIYGEINALEMTAIDEGISSFLGLSPN